MDCTKTYLRLSDYLDGRLSSDEASDVAAHLACCDECRGVVEDLQAVEDELRSEMAEVEPPPGLWQGIQARIAHDAEEEARHARPFFETLVEAVRRRRGWTAIPALGLAVFLLVFFAAPWSGPYASGPSLSGDTVAELEAQVDDAEQAVWEQELDSVVAAEMAESRRWRIRALDEAVDEVRSETYQDLMDDVSSEVLEANKG